MINKIQSIIERFDKISHLLTDPEIVTNQSKVTELARERSQLEEVVKKGREYVSIVKQIEDDKEMLAGNDPELKNIAQEELPS
ncbi:PCRF domain-containing protein, partial [Candidatus Neomarinimicrobiota bacterium]